MKFNLTIESVVGGYTEVKAVIGPDEFKDIMAVIETDGLVSANGLCPVGGRLAKTIGLLSQIDWDNHTFSDDEVRGILGLNRFSLEEQETEISQDERAKARRIMEDTTEAIADMPSAVRFKRRMSLERNRGEYKTKLPDTNGNAE